ncbi:MAG: RNA polymerase sigma-32 factor [Cycloclasticus pugetii]|jgi:RNA polymerase sigma-32 factor|uniref:RNA polymerase sigma factor n=2 Tax=Cycloclasticus TaxID=34067 RepID=S5T612_9GAMM|nr:MULTISPECIES: RNA polymerase sigma factor RpoH [Cycloclasticus]AFT67845.1 RNA polymerase sigma factor [Cycloclasticus sp. P1]AGS38984.1 DNA-directed RNA polymerase, sigma subunit (sigma70/sigma32) [Cycloclasticus zancles 78-ME]ATI02612.1 RNA polymerase sigma factor RpoH [Cycloclasticus sp. PY97N]EPD12788.1 RNA polymerase factor sigma-32 [Cycloclasticus pugetii]MBV1899101.1 RNA polymerase sigma factor RpoH [Cycloclasticus sp.]
MTHALALPNQLSAGSLDAYIASVSSAPALTVEQERDLANRLRNENDLEAARMLVLSHMRYVIHIAKSYSGYGLALPDLIQEGSIGLMKAVKRFDPDMGVRLVSYAVHWIKSEIHEFVIKNWRIVKIATTKAQRKLFFNLRKHKKNLAWLDENEADAIANDLGVDKSAVYEMEKRLSNFDMAFDGHQDDNTESDELIHTPATFVTKEEHDPATLLETYNEEAHDASRLNTALSNLDDRSRSILAERWLSEKKSTLHELADKYQVSAERIRQLEKNAMNKVKQELIEYRAS